MKYSTRLSDAVHIMVYIAMDPETGLTSDAIANSICTNPAFVRQMMSSLRNAGLIESTRGRASPKLARDVSEISLLDIYRAVEGDKPLLHQDTHTNPMCGLGVNIQYSLKDFYDEIQAEMEAKMAGISLSDIIENYHRHLASWKQPTM